MSKTKSTVKSESPDVEIQVRTAVLGLLLGYLSSHWFKDASAETLASLGLVAGYLVDLALFKLKTWLKAK